MIKRRQNLNHVDTRSLLHFVQFPFAMWTAMGFGALDHSSGPLQGVPCLWPAIFSSPHCHPETHTLILKQISLLIPQTETSVRPRSHGSSLSSLHRANKNLRSQFSAHHQKITTRLWKRPANTQEKEERIFSPRRGASFSCLPTFTGTQNRVGVKKWLR